MHRFRNDRIRALLYAGKPNWDLLGRLTHPENTKSRYARSNTAASP
jgi:hypothetical protein